MDALIRRMWRTFFLAADDKTQEKSIHQGRRGKVVVGGGTGFIGKALCEELTKREVRVIRLTKDDVVHQTKCFSMTL